MEHLYKRIALTLKNLRKARGWSLDKAAAATGVSKAMLGQIEREESSPTIATLWKIASGFQTSFSSFIEELQAHSNEPVYRAGRTKQLHPSDEKIRVLTLFSFDRQLNFELFVIELLPGCKHLSPPHKHGVIEHIIVLEGIMDILIDNSWQTLHQGEGLRFEASKPHGYRNTTTSTARFHNIIHYP